MIGVTKWLILDPHAGYMLNTNTLHSEPGLISKKITKEYRAKGIIKFSTFVTPKGRGTRRSRKNSVE